MKLQQLQALVAVVDSGGIRAAARQLHLSQAAVTKSMRSLEEDAGVPLLLRHSRGVTLTPVGSRLLVRARLVMRQMALAEQDLRDAGQGDGGSLRVGVTPLVTLTVLGEALAWFRQRFRHVELQVNEGLIGPTLPRLRDGTLDLALVASDPGELADGEFALEPVMRLSQCVVARQEHPLLQPSARGARRAPSAQALAGQEWVFTSAVPMSTGGLPPRGAALFEGAGVPAPERVLLCDTLAAFTLLRHTDALSVFPRPLLGQPETRGLVEVPGRALAPPDIDLVLLARAGEPPTSAASYLAHCLRECCRQRLAPAEVSRRPR